MNSSTHRFIKNNLKRTSRIRLLRSHSRMNCVLHGVQDVADFFPSKQVLLSCGCRRDCFLRTPEEIRAFDEASAEHEARKQVAGKNCVNANGYCVTFVEDVEEIAA